MNVLGLKINSHDTGAALISNERVIAIAEERLCRVKHSFNIFPQLSIDYCLREFDLEPKDIDLIVIDQVDHRDKWPMKKWFLERVRGDFSSARIEVINHHDAHAASSFFCSPFREAAVLVYDGSGEKFTTHLGVVVTETESLYRAEDNRLYTIQKTSHLQEEKRFPYTFGVGKLYQRISENYLGFGKYNEGKMMGLAPYGTDSVLKEFPLERWVYEKDGHVLCNAQFTYPARPISHRINSLRSLDELWNKSMSFLKNKFSRGFRAVSKKVGAYYYGHFFMEPNFFSHIRLKHPARSPVDPLPDKYYASVAYMAQKVLESVARRWGMRLKNLVESENLCVAGGVGLNIDANRNFLDEVGFKDIFIQPASSDTGIALGCALWGWHMVLNMPRFFKMETASLGRSYSEEDIISALEKRKSEVHFKKSDNISRETAEILSKGRIIGWHQGGAEYGPRALGNRSIICDARGVDMKDILNNRVKHREEWRPFATSILRESLSEWFDLDTQSSATAFMLLAAPVKKNKRAEVPSIVHIDGTCRMQTLTSSANGRYYDLVKEFDNITGVPLVLNTSFNLGGEPIVETPDDSLKCFLSTEIDYLVIEDYLIWKR